ncbi:hypothetical protein D3C77_593860 [compost metagenome]
MTEVDLHLCRTVFVNQRVEVQALGFAPVVDVFKQRIEFVGSIDRKRLPTTFGAAGTAQWRLQR